MFDIHAVVVNVNYSEYFCRAIDRWLADVTSLIMVTDRRDEAAVALARSRDCPLLRTDIFYHGGAYFSKGAAIQEARALLPLDSFHLLIDADVIPPEDWKVQLEAADPQPGILHGAIRVREDGAPIPDRELAGFFQLYHGTDPRAAEPLAGNFYHAAAYDSLFMMRWPASLQRILPLTLVHLGEPGVNWCGRGNDQAMAELRAARRRGRSWKRETVR